MRRAMIVDHDRIPSTLRACGIALVLTMTVTPEAYAADAVPALRVQNAERTAGATHTMILAATRAGRRIVAVGERGVVLLSDDDGKSYCQAQAVPVASTLTGVWFSSEKTGWAVGHWGAILRTSDAGETWVAQRSDLETDQPLFGVYFKDEKEGWAVGLWSLMLHTTDAGETWTPVALPPPAGAKKADRNLYAIFADLKGGLFVASEQGRVLRSANGGATWTYTETGYPGSFWTGVALQDRTLLVGGLRGTVYRSANGGDSWIAVSTPYKSSITGMTQLADRTVVTVGLDGATLISHDDGVTFTGVQRPDRATLTAVATTSTGRAVVFSVDGPTESK